jgi:uncharacterized repeat protein (TIGR03809 family)
MTHRLDAARGRNILERWCALAERRLDYLTELFESGRWRRYHSEASFLENIREAKSAVEIWRDLAVREASRDNSPIDISWLGRTRDVLSRSEPRHEAGRLPQLPEIMAAPPLSDLSTARKTAPAISGAALSGTTSGAPAKPGSSRQESALTLDLTVMQQRYPLLRHATL